MAQTTPWKTELVPPAPRIAVDHMGEGKLVICMHGIGGNRTNWHDQIPEFGRHFHAASWDARGYGRSDDYEGPLEFHDFARDLARVLDHFGARKAHLIGLSMGGLIAMDFHALFPERVASLTLCDTLPGFGHLSPEQSREFIRLRLEPLRAGKELKEIAVGVAQSLIGKSSPPPAFQRLVDSMCALHKQSYIKTIEGTANSGLQIELEKIRVPTHVVVGEDDLLTPPALARSIAERISGARLTIIKSSGHLPNLERPLEFNAAVLPFLLEHRDAAQ
ncbi:MAG TPA: alpha/beta fold hydrolase [Candidatus Binataceae bacterium]|nr:alpha/beta fold hydrolase [Candidatus Binataceae bacterium]